MNDIDQFVHPLAVCGGETNDALEPWVLKLERRVLQLNRTKSASGDIEEAGRRVTHIDNHINLALALLLKDAVAGTDQPSATLQQVNLLQWTIGLEERFLCEGIKVWIRIRCAAALDSLG